MKTIMLFAMAFVCSLTVPAQPTIPSSQYATQTGSFQYKIKYLQDADANPGLSGANVIWDFSNMPGDTTLTSIVGLCPGENICNEFPEATQYSKTGTGNSYTMYKKNNSSFEVVGSYNGVDPYYHNANTEKVAVFPITYNQSFTDIYASNNATATIKGTVDLLVDGYGTLITPVGTYNDVLRIKRVKTDTTIIGATISVVRSTTYEWVKTGMPTIAGMLKGQILFPVQQVSQAVFSYTPLDNVTALQELDQLGKHMTIYPNPAIGENVQLKITDCIVSSLRMLDITGRLLYDEKISDGQADIFQIPVKNISPGIYMVIVNTNLGSMVKRVTISR